MNKDSVKIMSISYNYEIKDSIFIKPSSLIEAIEKSTNVLMRQSLV